MAKDVNIIIVNGDFRRGDKELFFQGEEVFFSSARDLQELCVEFGAFKSRGEAFRAGRKGEIPWGLNEIWLNRKVKAFVLNPHG